MPTVRDAIIRLLRFLLQRLSARQRSNTPCKATVEEIIASCNKVMENKKLYLKRSLSSETLSREVGTNRAYLLKALSQKGGFNAYVNSYRIRYACALMESDIGYDMKISEIAELSGFSTERSMNYYVVKTYGFSTRQLRRRVDMAVQAKNFSTSLTASGSANTATRS